MAPEYSAPEGVMDRFDPRWDNDRDRTQFAWGGRSGRWRSDKTWKQFGWKNLEGWYRYGDSNPGPVAENHVS